MPPGGDDVRQLCEAGEEEFLEIMALVGMASKPLHVRRLQKALQEWVNNPGQWVRNLGQWVSSHDLVIVTDLTVEDVFVQTNVNHLVIFLV